MASTKSEPKETLWTRNFTIMTTATVLGAAGGVAGSFALSFLVFEETGSTLAAAILIAIQVVPRFVIPLALSPIMDRLPRKPFLVGGDVANGLLYALAGTYLLLQPFDYIKYLFFTLLLATLQAFDELAFTAIYPKLIPGGFEQQGYTVSNMVYPILKVVMLPIAAWLMDVVGVAWMLVGQGACSIGAALIENRIKLVENRGSAGSRFSLKTWWSDIVDAVRFLAKDRGLASNYLYIAFTNGIADGLAPILVAFFSTATGFTTAMYSFFSVFEFAGRSLGGVVSYKIEVKPQKKFRLTFLIYQIYELSDAILLWLPYPAMLVNRALVGFLGMNSAALRSAAVQRYIPEEYRARLAAFQSVLWSCADAVLSLFVGSLGEVLDYRWCYTVGGLAATAILWATLWASRRELERIFNPEDEQ